MSLATPSNIVRTSMASARSDDSGSGILRLDSNECVGGEPLSASNGIRPGIIQSRYPDSGRIERVLARRECVEPDRIVATAGADDAIDRVCRACLEPGSSVLLAEPTFTMFRRFSEAQGAAVRSVPWLSGSFPTSKFIDAARDRDLVALVSPNNPTGLSIPIESLMTLRMEVPEPVLLVDLAYVEFGCEAGGSDLSEIIDALRWMPKTVLVRTMSKAWGMAGLRVGWTESDSGLADRIRAAGGPYPIASSSIESACEVLGDPGSDADVADRVCIVGRNREAIRSTIEGSGLDAGGSVANFLLVSDPEDDGRAEWLGDGLAGLDVVVRRFEEDILQDRIRITIPVGRRENRRLERSVSTVLDPEAILFDLDGVLADVSGSYRLAITKTAMAFGVRVTDKDIERIKAEGDANDDWVVTRRLLLERGVDIDMETIVERFQSLYLGDGPRLGLRERERSFVDADRLAGAVRGRAAGVVTGRPAAEAEWFLRRSGLDGMIDVVIAREDAPLKPDPRGIVKAMESLGVRDAWFLGDTVDDVSAARAVPGNRVLPIGVDPLGSPASVRSLLDAGASRVVGAGSQMTDLLEEVLS